MKRHTYTLLGSFAPSEFPSVTNNGPAKSKPTWMKGGSLETLSLGRSTVGLDLYEGSS